jgi:hypothetical protein
VRDVPRIKAAYDWLIRNYQAEVSQSLADGKPEAVDRLEGMRDTLERGVFVVLFGQFENEVDSCFVQARDNRAGNPDWTARRGWDVPAYADRRIPFETKLALVHDRAQASHGKILQTYGLRNHCAHGGTDQPVGSIDQLVDDLYSWQSQLRR